MKQLIECVPNFSEGNDMQIINQITAAIESVEGVRLLNVDPGKATNRTVVTFVGEPEYVVEAAFRGIAKAAELIDMTRHSGAHPRMGATDQWRRRSRRADAALRRSQGICASGHSGLG